MQKPALGPRRRWLLSTGNAIRGLLRCTTNASVEIAAKLV